MDQLMQEARQLGHGAWELVRPGGLSHELQWEPFIAANGHFLVEIVLVVAIAYLLLQKGKPTGRESEPLTEREVEELCEQWQPEPLCPALPESNDGVSNKIVERVRGAYAQVNGKEVVNFCSMNFLGAGGQSEILESCVVALNKYGCGSCGPRGFYGTIDVHLQLEDHLSRFMGTEEAIIYSYDVATLPSIIPAFANRKDVIICDEAVNFSIQNGCNLSRGQLHTFRHNDMEDLRRVMEGIAAEDRRKKKKLNRKYVVVEGIYANSGEVAPLDRIYELKEEFKYRMIVDESVSLGVLGATGRGACEHFGLLGRVEIVAASMGNSLGSIGGFCCGDREICDHQRLSGSGYCFSASLPPFLATAALGSLRYIEDEGMDKVAELQDKSALLRRQLASAVRGLKVVGGLEDEMSPLIHLRLDRPDLSTDLATETLNSIASHCLSSGVLVSVNCISKLDTGSVAPTIKLAVTAQHSVKDLSAAVEALMAATAAIL